MNRRPLSLVGAGVFVGFVVGVFVGRAGGDHAVAVVDAGVVAVAAAAPPMPGREDCVDRPAQPAMRARWVDGMTVGADGQTASSGGCSYEPVEAAPVVVDAGVADVVAGSGKMFLGAPVVLGSLSKGVIVRVFTEHADQLKYCYDKQVLRNPGLAGQVVLKFVINGEGRTTAASVAETSLRNPNVEQCLSTKVKTFVFAQVQGGGIVVVNYPLTFRTGT